MKKVDVKITINLLPFGEPYGLCAHAYADMKAALNTFLTDVLNKVYDWKLTREEILELAFDLRDLALDYIPSSRHSSVNVDAVYREEDSCLVFFYGVETNRSIKQTYTHKTH